MPGVAAGAMLAPALALGSRLRHARVFHPRGSVLWGRAIAIDSGDEAARAFGERLEGPVLARFSGAWWKQRQWIDVLGCALRFTHAERPQLEPMARDQDLLLATVRIPVTTPFAPLSTHVDDYLRNAYFGVSPFVAPPLGRIKLRLRALQAAPSTGAGLPRGQLLDYALEHGPLQLTLEARSARPLSPYRPVARIELFERVDVDQEALSFDPFRAGRELVPAGFVHAMRMPVYAASRAARPSRATG
jgi:hypothetical protein